MADHPLVHVDVIICHPTGRKTEVTPPSSAVPSKELTAQRAVSHRMPGGDERTYEQRTSFRRLGCGGKMKIAERIKEAAATGYILLWLLGIPIPILLIIFLLRGCS